jgi:hypothetical protein
LPRAVAQPSRPLQQQGGLEVLSIDAVVDRWEDLRRFYRFWAAWQRDHRCK